MAFSLKKLVCMTALVCTPLVSMAQFVVSPLPYATDALEPFIDKTTMEIHHDRHHAAYVKNLNDLAKETTDIEKMSIEDINRQISKYNTGIRNNAGGHYNHELFWKVMAPQGQTGEPSPALITAINQAFGSMDDMKKQFSKAAATRFGSGWAWLIVLDDKTLAITSTPNQDNPLMDLPEIKKGTPVLGLDVWEHAYYLKYQNKRGDYIDGWWNLVNWNEVNQRFAEATR